MVQHGEDQAGRTRSRFSRPKEDHPAREAVIAALAAGKESPPDGVKYIKDTFDIDLTKGNFSTIKSQIKKAAGESKPAAKPGRPASKPSVAPSMNGDPATLARQVKSLVAQYGAAAVKGMVEVFAE